MEVTLYVVKMQCISYVTFMYVILKFSFLTVSVLNVPHWYELSDYELSLRKIYQYEMSTQSYFRAG